MSKPTELPRWATALASPSDIVDPLSGKKDIGWQDSEMPPHSYMNWLFNLIYLWCAYLDGLTGEALTWTVGQIFSAGITVTGGATIDTLNLTTANLATLNVSGFSSLHNTGINGTLNVTAGGTFGGVSTTTLGTSGLATLASLLVTGSTNLHNTTVVGKIAGTGDSADGHGGPAKVAMTMVGGSGDAGGGTPNGAAGAQLFGGSADAGGSGGTAMELTAGINGDGITYGKALKILHGNIDQTDGDFNTSGNILAQGNIAAVGDLTAAAGNVLAGGVNSQIAHPVPATMTLNPGGGSWSAVGGLIPKYWKDAFGVVHLEGVPGNGLLSDVIATLPVGFRPPLGREFPAVQGGTTATLIVIDTSGHITSGVDGGAGGVTLDGITFRTN